MYVAMEILLHCNGIHQIVVTVECSGIHSWPNNVQKWMVNKYFLCFTFFPLCTMYWMSLNICCFVFPYSHSDACPSLFIHSLFGLCHIQLSLLVSQVFPSSMIALETRWQVSRSIVQFSICLGLVPVHRQWHSLINHLYLCTIWSLFPHLNHHLLGIFLLQ